MDLKGGAAECAEKGMDFGGFLNVTVFGARRGCSATTALNCFHLTPQTLTERAFQAVSTSCQLFPNSRQSHSSREHNELALSC